ncbi:MAG: UDP-3-O-acyl-N-acetylglucosamine deacetylase [Candidatus Shapirobacteria bacterium]|jgi:UDP-3-O-[3-hydroxymyristoyl] N-acetylglucosamine deacetylase
MIELIKIGKQRTVREPFIVDGPTPYLDNHTTRVKVVPAQSGFRFFVRGGEIKVIGANTKSTDGIHATYLTNRSGKEVRLTEHLLSALTGMGVTAADIYLEGSSQVPVPDRTAKIFCREIKKVGIKDTREDLLCAKVVKDIYFTDGLGSFVIFRPCDTTKISALIQFSSLFEDQYLKIELNQENYWSEIMWARPFVRVDCPTNDDYLKAIRLLRAFPKKMEDSPAMVRSNGVWVTGIKPMEPVRHKILDIIGDLTTLGFPIQADMSFIRPGHEFHRKLIGFLWGLVNK